jgi:hypothetical protein
MMDAPSIRPYGNPSWSTPTIRETTAAAKRIWLMRSSKFSMTNSQRLLICGGGKKFGPKAFYLCLISSGVPVIPIFELDFKFFMMESTP